MALQDSWQLTRPRICGSTAFRLSCPAIRAQRPPARAATPADEQAKVKQQSKTSYVHIKSTRHKPNQASKQQQQQQWHCMMIASRAARARAPAAPTLWDLGGSRRRLSYSSSSNSGGTILTGTTSTCIGKARRCRLETDCNVLVA